MEGGWLKDGRIFSLQFSPQIVTEGIELTDARTGDDAPLSEYYRRNVE